MVFLRPIVMRDADSANKFSTDRYEMMRSIQQGSQPAPNRILGINEAPVLPERMGTSLTNTVLPAASPQPAAQ